MSRNQPFDFSDDEDISIASGGANTPDAEHTEFGWSDSPEMTSAMEDTGRHSKKARQQSPTATHTRRSAEQPDSPTSMSHKRGNQPR